MVLAEASKDATGLYFVQLGLLTRNAAVAMPIPRATVEAMNLESKE
jgi:hypothetical protein